jgi:hypothetical protein
VLLLQVCMCVCFCHYVEQQLQELHDDAQVMVTRLLDSQQQHQQQENNTQHAGHEQQQQYALANGIDHSLQNNSSWQAAAQQQQQQPNGPPAAAAAGPGGSRQQQQDEQLSQAAAAKLRVLAKPIGEFSTCRREWVLKLGKAAALGFMQHAAGTYSAVECWDVGIPFMLFVAGLLAIYSTGLHAACSRRVCF